MSRPGCTSQFVLSVGTAAKFTLAQCLDSSVNIPIREAVLTTRGQPSQASVGAGRHAALLHAQALTNLLRKELRDLKLQRDQMQEAITLLD